MFIFVLPEPGPAIAAPPFTGIVGGVAQWVFVRGDVASVTVSAADKLSAEDAMTIADQTWQDVAIALNLSIPRPSKYRVIKAKRATFAQTPDQVAKRPSTQTGVQNLFLAGSHVDHRPAGHN